MVPRTVRLQPLLIGLIALVLLVALVPAGLVVDRRLASSLEARARDDLARAVRIARDRREVEAGALMMHAKEAAALPAVTRALVSNSPGDGARALAEAVAVYGEGPALYAGDERLAGPALPAALVDATRDGGMPVDVVEDGTRLYRVALAPVMDGETWVGAAGVVRPWIAEDAAVLAGLTRTDVWLLASDGSVLGTSSPSGSAPPPTPGAAPEAAAGSAWIATTDALGPGRVVFARDRTPDVELATGLRRAGTAGLGGGLALALLVGGLLAAWVSRPVRALATAAEGVTREDWAAGLVPTRVREIQRVAGAFDAMRTALAARLEELRAANGELRSRQERLASLQAELIRQDRLAASGQLVAQLAHEIRNPVANVRNCLEVVRRRLGDDSEARHFADLAVEELRRMHGLAERLLDLHRPGDPKSGHASAAAVAEEVAALAGIGAHPGFRMSVEGEPDLSVPMPPDTLKQVLASLVQNAREAMDGAGTVEVRIRRSGSLALIDVLDEGPGIPAEVMPRVFDPFFTTKRSVQGVGLGLFVAEATVRSHGGRLSCTNRSDGPGAAFRLELEAAGLEARGSTRAGA